MTGPLTPEDDALAAEYALSLLEGAERAAFERRLAAEPALAAAVARWQDGLAGLADEVAPVPPPARVKAALEARLFPEPPRGGPVSWLRGLMAGGLVAALVAALALAVLDLPQNFAPAFTAELQQEGGALRLVADLDPARGELRVARAAGGPPEGRVLELWALAGDAAPVSLGLLDGETVRLALPAGLEAGGLTLAVSEEPPGGSPTGQPTGEVLAVAEVRPL